MFLPPPPAPALLHRRDSVRASRQAGLLAPLLASFLVCNPATVAAQVGTVGDPVSIAARKTGGVRIVPVSGNAQHLVVADSAISTYAAPVRFSIAWNFPANMVNNFQLVGFFLDASGALRSGADGIPSAYVEGRVGTTASWGAFVSTYALPTSPPTASNALHLWTSPSTRNSGRKGEVTLDLHLRLNLTDREVPAGDYSGTLVLQALTQ